MLLSGSDNCSSMGIPDVGCPHPPGAARISTKLTGGHFPLLSHKRLSESTCSLLSPLVVVGQNANASHGLFSFAERTSDLAVVGEARGPATLAQLINNTSCSIFPKRYSPVHFWGSKHSTMCSLPPLLS